MCTNCHSRAGVFSQLSGGKASKSQDMAHSALPYATQHLSSLRCIDCHADATDTTLHRILPASQTIGCEQCHGDGSLLSARPKTFAPDENTIAGSKWGKGLFDDLAL
ncbi:cytochrome c family protein, partial [Escherichia coli]|uniref:multiheme c-type cytochrome n=1 Tax=Escherichia coli TaxID=562 RepID=UPI0022453FCD